MPKSTDHDPAGVTPPQLSGADRRTYESLFAHPSSHNLKWHDVMHLFETLGSVTEKSNHEYVLTVGAAPYVMRRPHSKDLTSEEIRDLRHFVSSSLAHPDPSAQPALDLLIVIDHHEARIFATDMPSHGTTQENIRPYDPHHFLHHLTHKDQPREHGQRAHEDATFYDRIAQAVVNAARIVIIGHGTGKSDAADHLVAYIHKNHSQTGQKILCELTADLSHITAPQLIALAREALGTSTRT